MQISDHIWRQLLVDTEILKETDFLSAQKEAKQSRISFEDLLVQKNLITEKQLSQVLSLHFGLPFVDLSTTPIKQTVLEIVPELVASKHRIICYKLDTEGVHLAVEDPTDTAVVPLIEKKTGSKAILHLAAPSQIDEFLAKYSSDIAKTLDELIAQTTQPASDKTASDPPIIAIVEAILNYGVRNKASDIHMEPLDTEAVIRFRIDGLLHDVVSTPPAVYTRIVARIKVLAQLKTDEHLAAQDGKFRYSPQLEGMQQQVDVRVSIAPVTTGEKIVLRLLAEQNKLRSLRDLGLMDKGMKKIQQALAKPHGMILATGPTGSGKTTTLYVLLQMLNKPDVNIMTIEDPVEYDIERINQMQVNEATGLTFADGLRSIVRQDPDIILIGEIRDSETAEIAINSALTGHQVLSTLHTNDAATTLPRLIDMGVEPFLIASSVNIIIGQRLVRKICESCAVSRVVKREDLSDKLDQAGLDALFAENDEINLYQGKGCELCHDTGYVGRVGIFEVLEVTDTIREAITNRQDAATISKLAIQEGMTTMVQCGLEKAIRGITTIEEVLRTIHE